MKIEKGKVALGIRFAARCAVGWCDFMRVIPILVILFPGARKSTQNTCFFLENILMRRRYAKIFRTYLKIALNSASRKEPFWSPLAASQTAFKMQARPSLPFSSSRIFILVKTSRRSRLCSWSESSLLRKTLVSVGSSNPRPTVAPHVNKSVARYVPHVKQ